MMKYEKNKSFLVVLCTCLVFLFSGCSMKNINHKKAMFLYQDGMKLSSQGDFDGALEKFNASIKISEENKFMPGVAHNYNEIGNIYTYKKKFNIARQYYQKANEIYKEQNMTTETSKSFDNIAKTYVRQNDYDQALKEYEHLLSWDMETSNLLGAGLTNFNMALICEKYTLDYKRARKLYKDALDIFTELNREKEAKEAHKGIIRLTY